MPAPHILVVTTDATLGRVVAASLERASCTVEVRGELAAPAPGERVPDVCVLHAGDPRQVRVDRLPACPVLVAVPAIDLATMVDLVYRSERVAGLLRADPALLVPAVLQSIGPGLAGPETRLAPGTPIESHTVADFDDKRACQLRLASFVERLGFPRSRREDIDQCIDEMLMNALYDAPIDARGRHVFEGVSARERVRLRTAQSVLVRWGHDGRRLVVAVRDAFGSLARETVARHLDKALHAAEVVDRKAGGAGLGLYLMTNAASGLWFDVVPGVGTEVVCELEVETSGLERFGWFAHDPAGRAATRPVRRQLVARYRVRRAAAAALGAAVIAAGVIAWPHVFVDHSARVTVVTAPGAAVLVDGRPAGIATDGTLEVGGLVDRRAYRFTATRDGYAPSRTARELHRGDNSLDLPLEPLATLDIDSQPRGALVEIDGHPAGSTPLHVTTLAPGSTVAIAMALPGSRAVTTRVQVPPRGQERRVSQQLAPDSDLVRVHLFSSPPGATVLESGQAATADRTFTPADVFVPAGQLARFTLTMPGHAPLVIEPFAPAAGSASIDKGGELIPK